METHCQTHYLSNNRILLDDEIDDKLIIKNKLAQGLLYLRNILADLKWGDLIVFRELSGYRNSGVFIFNGTDIVPLNYTIDDYGSLPKEFHVIQDGVPIMYWKPQEAKKVIGIEHNSFVWFDHKLVRDQCIKNIKYGMLYSYHSQYDIYTTFEYKTQGEYRIIFDYEQDDEDEEKDKKDVVGKYMKILVDIFNKDDKIIFQYISENYDSDDRTLFIDNNMLQSL